MAEEAPKRKSRRTLIGIVTSAKTDKTRRVEVPWLSKVAKYGKYIRRRTVCYVHDEKNESALGDQVEIMEARPMSKTKRWRLVRVVSHDMAVPKGVESQDPSAKSAPEDQASPAAEGAN